VFNFMPSPEMMAKLGIGAGQQMPGMDGGGGGMGGNIMSILQDPSFLQNIMGQRGNPMQGGQPPMGGPPMGQDMMRRTMPMGPRIQAPGGEAGGGRISGPPMASGPQKPGMMSRFGNAAAAAAPMVQNMLREDEDKKRAMLYR
jgi:hypothetical protein